MLLRRKLLIAVIVNCILVGFVYYYFWVLNKENYFPDNYETAFSCMGYTIIFGLAIILLVVIHHNFSHKKK